MTHNYALRPRAQRDLEEIWDFTAGAWSDRQAETYIRQTQHCLELLASDPHLGQACDEIRKGYRRHPAGSHVIYYRTTVSGIDIARILHQRMDTRRIL